MTSDLAYYSLDNQISTFFQAHNSVTREQCDKYAASIAGEPVTPEPIQGTWSYTVTAGPKQSSIVQFRSPSSALDMDLLTLARATHGIIVPNCVYRGTIGQPTPLPVYVMDKLPGVPYSQVQPSPSPGRPMSPAAASRVINTVTDFARLLLVSSHGPFSTMLRLIDTQLLRFLLAESAGNGSICHRSPPHRIPAEDESSGQSLALPVR